MIDVPALNYARSGDISVAYQVVGDGPVDYVWIRGHLADLESSWEQPLFVAYVEELSELGRVILFDKRGTGLSDRMREAPTLETRMDDVRAILDEIGSEEAVVFGGYEGARLAVLFAATYPERTLGVILADPAIRGTRSPEYPWAPDEDDWRRRLAETRDRWGDDSYLEQLLRDANPSIADDDGFRRWFIRQMRRSASPGAAVAFQRMVKEGDVTDVLPLVQVPALVLHREGFREQAEYVVRQLPNAKLVALHGVRDGYYWANESAREQWLDATRDFIASLRPEHALERRVLATVLFTDIVDSTKHVAETSDSEWGKLLARHHALVRREIARYQGVERDTAGDGFFATFDGPARAVYCARAIVDAVRELGIEIRAGVHSGECEAHGDRITGIAVHTGARIASLANPGEVLVSQTVKDLAAGSGIEFEERGEHELKGVPGRWRVYAASSSTEG